MLDFGWAELFVVMVVAVFAIGPNELPGLMRGLGRVVRRFQYVKHAISQQFDEFMEVGDIAELQDAVNFEAKPEGHEGFDEAKVDEDESIQPPKKEAGNE